MTTHWTDKRTAKAALGAALRERGWMLYGWSDDQSDSMTDCYCPANWSGVATLDGCVLAVAASDRDSGREQMRTEWVRGEGCARCEGSGIDPLRITLSDARANPEEYCRRVEEAIGDGTRALVRSVVSPIPFRDDGFLRCTACNGHGAKLEERRIVECVWPTFRTTPRGSTWHIEREGQIIAKGSGVFTIASQHSSYAAQATAAAALADRITAATASRPVTTREATAAGDAGGASYEILPSRIGRGGVIEVRFAEKPPAEVRDALKAARFRWNRRAGVWYGPEDALPAALDRREEALR